MARFYLVFEDKNSVVVACVFISFYCATFKIYIALVLHAIHILIIRVAFFLQVITEDAVLSSCWIIMTAK